MPTSETPKITALNELKHLKQCGFGRPPPRHGLNLLHWFSTQFINFRKQNSIDFCYDPKSNVFGFHKFENKFLSNGEKLLPEIYEPYYIVGNLHKPGSKSLPHYILDNYTGKQDGSNTDRIIVSLSLDRIYVTEHSDQRNFNPVATFRISKGLLYIISRMDRIKFLTEMGYYERPAAPLYNYSSQIDFLISNVHPTSKVEIMTGPKNDRTSGTIMMNTSTPSPNSTGEFRLKMPEEQDQASKRPPRSRGLWDYCNIL